MIGVLNALWKTHADDLVPIALYLCAQLLPRPPVRPGPLRRGRRYGRQRGYGAALRAHGHTSLRGRPEPAVPGPVSRGGRGDARGGRRGEFDDAQRTDLLGAYWRWHIDAVERGAKGDRRVCARCVLRERDEE